MGNVDAVITTWASDGKWPPYEECVMDIHVFDTHGKSYNDVVCRCGKTRWTFVTCPTCRRRHGEAVPVEAPKMDEKAPE